MKKQTSRLVLNKITIKDLTHQQLGAVAGGALPWTKHSVCAEQSCESDRTANCPKTF